LAYSNLRFYQAWLVQILQEFEIDEPLPINRKKAEEEKAPSLGEYFKETKKGVNEQLEVSAEQKTKLQEERQARHEGVLEEPLSGAKFARRVGPPPAFGSLANSTIKRSILQ